MVKSARTTQHQVQSGGNATYDRAEQIDEHEEAHREAAETEQLWQEQQFTQIVHRRVDPATTLRQQHAPRLGGDRACLRIRRELRLECREVLHEECREETILSEREQILLVQCVDERLSVFVNDTAGDDDRATLIGSTDAVKRETTGQASDGTKEGLERLGQVVRDVVFVHLSAQRY